MNDLVTWLRAQLDEDERVARDAAEQDWSRALSYAGDLAEHVDMHNPARVLAEVEAKRAIIDLQVRATEAGDHAMHTAYEAGRIDWLDEVLSLLALPYADQPGYDENWRP